MVMVRSIDFVCHGLVFLHRTPKFNCSPLVDCSNGAGDVNNDAIATNTMKATNPYTTGFCVMDRTKSCVVEDAAFCALVVTTFRCNVCFPPSCWTRALNPAVKSYAASSVSVSVSVSASSSPIETAAVVSLLLSLSLLSLVVGTL